jgi:hypothetical protein
LDSAASRPAWSVPVPRAHAAQHDVGGGPGGGGRHRAARGGAHVVIVGEGAQQVIVQPEVEHLRPVQGLRDPGDPRVFPVQDHGPGGLGRDVLEQLGGLVDLAETVQLVAEDIEQEAVPRRDLVDEVHGMRLVQFQDRDVGIEPAPPVHLAQERRGHAAGEVAAGAVGEDLQPLALEQFHHHLGGGGLPVRATDDGDPQRQRGQRPPHEVGVDFFDHKPGEGRASAPEPGDPADELAERNAEVKHAL